MKQRIYPGSIRTKRAFTIVELIIVIAVIGVLAAILIPTFTGVIRKANTSSDVSDCKNMNTTIAAEHTSRDDFAPLSYEEATQALADAGWSVTKTRTAVEGTQYYFDTDLQTILYVEHDADTNTDTVIYPKDYAARTELEAIAAGGEWLPIVPFSDIATDEGMMLTADYTLQKSSTITVVGDENYIVDLQGHTLDLGGKTLSIIGSTTGTVDFTNGTIKNGEIRVNVPQGNLALHANSESSVGWNVATIAESSFHVFGRIEGTLKMQAGRLYLEQNSYVFAVAVEEASKSVKIEIATGAQIIALYVSNESVPQVMVNNGGTVATATSIEGSRWSGAASGHVNVTEDLFFGGNGSENSPFLIANTIQWNNMYDKLVEADGYYFALISDIDFTNKEMDNVAINEWDAVFTLDGNKHMVKGMGNFSGYFQPFPNLYDATIKNIDFTFAGPRAALSYRIDGGENLFQNVRTYGEIKAVNANTFNAIYCQYLYAGAITFDNCVNYATVAGNAQYPAVFTSHADSSTLVSMTFKNCVNYGDIYGQNAAAFAGMGQHTEKYSFEGTNVNYGNVYGTSAAYQLSAGGNTYFSQNIANYGTSQLLPTIALTLPTNFGDRFTFPTVPGATEYSVTVKSRRQAFNYEETAICANIWGGDFPLQFNEMLYAYNGQSSLTSNFIKGYILETEADTYYNFRTDEEVEYNGLFVPEDFTYVQNANIQTYKGQKFYCYDATSENGYYGLLQTKHQNGTEPGIGITFTVSAFTPTGRLIAAGTVSYSYTVQQALDFIASMG